MQSRNAKHSTTVFVVVEFNNNELFILLQLIVWNFQFYFKFHVYDEQYMMYYYHILL